ncbi:MAG: pyridoxamine 5'-phosphate oxidase family protein [Desulfomonile tiedjei]|nr:pyridoxamine 5'-phosphate oxidase family protein [Desulfomonile tiedjei]
MNRQELEQIVTGYMDSYTTMTLACTSEGQPWAAAVFYARDGLDLIFFSSRTSRHSKAISEKPTAAATIHGDYRGWKEIKGLQMNGRVEPVSGRSARGRALSLYLKRYPFVSEFFSSPLSVGVSVAKKMSKIELYLFRPERILYVNNEAGFGTRWQLEVREGQSVGEPTLA